MHGWAITCGKCKKASEAGLWIETLAGQKRPREHYQCPACGVAFIRKSAPPTTCYVGDEVRMIPGDVTLEFIEPVHRYDNNTISFKRGRP